MDGACLDMNTMLVLTLQQAPEMLQNLMSRIGRRGSGLDGTFYGNPYDVACDIYSTSVVVWECVTSRLPYSEHKINLFELEKQIALGLRPSEGQIDDGQGGVVTEHLCRAIEDGWSEDPFKRTPLQKMAELLNQEITSGS